MGGAEHVVPQTRVWMSDTTKNHSYFGSTESLSLGAAQRLGGHLQAARRLLPSALDGQGDAPPDGVADRPKDILGAAHRLAVERRDHVARQQSSLPGVTDLTITPSFTSGNSLRRSTTG
jgi:hypothetical protein